MKSSTPWMAILLVLTLGSTLPSAAFASAEEPLFREARTFLASLGEQIIDVARDKVSPRRVRESRIRDRLREDFDLNVISRIVLGKHWRRISQDQRKMFIEVFTDAMVQQILTLFAKYSGETFDITAVGSDRTNDKLIAITVTVMRSNGTLLAKVYWRILKDGDHFKVVDIVIEGISLALTLRHEYAAVIERSDGRVDGLIEQLRKSFARKQDSDNAGTGQRSDARR